MVRRSPPRQVTTHPVSSYRSIAISFLALAAVLVGLVLFMSTKKAVITIETRPEPKTFDGRIVFSGIDDEQGVVSFITSTVVVVTSTFTPTGAMDIPGKSGGSVTLTNTSAQTQRLVVQTRLQTGDGRIYRLTAPTTVPAHGSVTAMVLADEEGSSYDIAPTRFTIPGLSGARQKVVYAENTEPFTGGVSTVGAFGEEDLTRVYVAAQKKAEDQITSILPATPASSSRTFFATKVKEELSASVGSVTGSVSATHTIRVVLVQYEKNDLAYALEEMVNKQRTVKHTAFSMDSNDTVIRIIECVSKDARCTAEAHVSGTESLRADTDALALVQFAGKSKDEVRRYVQTLPYVAWVEVSISPSWQRTVPDFTDNIRVVVKKTKESGLLDTK